MESISTVESAWEYLTECGIATDDELALITSINGDRIETYEDVLYFRTGYRSFDQVPSGCL